MLLWYYVPHRQTGTIKALGMKNGINTVALKAEINGLQQALKIVKDELKAQENNHASNKALFDDKEHPARARNLGINRSSLQSEKAAMLATRSIILKLEFAIESATDSLEIKEFKAYQSLRKELVVRMTKGININEPNSEDITEDQVDLFVGDDTEIVKIEFMAKEVENKSDFATTKADILELV